MNTNKENKTTVVKSVASFSSLLGIAFIILKLCHVINWSWLWVLSPFWISLAITLFFLIFAVVVAIIA